MLSNTAQKKYNFFFYHSPFISCKLVWIDPSSALIYSLLTSSFLHKSTSIDLRSICLMYSDFACHQSSSALFLQSLHELIMYVFWDIPESLHFSLYQSTWLKPVSCNTTFWMHSVFLLYVLLLSNSQFCRMLYSTQQSKISF